MKVKAEPLDSGGSNPNSSDPTAGSESEKEKPLKRKEREKKVINRIDLIILIRKQLCRFLGFFEC